MIDKEKLDELMKMAGEKGHNVNNEKVQNLINNLGEKEKQKVENILNDQQKLQQILNSPAAQQLLKKLSEK